LQKRRTSGNQTARLGDKQLAFSWRTRFTIVECQRLPKRPAVLDIVSNTKQTVCTAPVAIGSDKD
jgi:hypothetical protein